MTRVQSTCDTNAKKQNFQKSRSFLSRSDRRNFQKNQDYWQQIQDAKSRSNNLMDSINTINYDKTWETTHQPEKLDDDTSDDARGRFVVYLVLVLTANV